MITDSPAGVHLTSFNRIHGAEIIGSNPTITNIFPFNSLIITKNHLLSFNYYFYFFFH